MKPNDDEFERLMNEVDKALSDTKVGAKVPTQKVTPAIAAQLLSVLPGVVAFPKGKVVLFEKDDVEDLSSLIIESACLLEELTKLIDPDNKTVIDGIMERIEDLVQVHENLENAIDSLDD